MVLKLSRAAIVLLLAALASAAGKPELRAAGQGTPPQVGVLRGRVEIARILSSPRPSSRSGSTDAVAFAPDVYRQAVVYLEPPPDRLERPSEGRARMDQRGERFVPHVLAIPTGTMVDFPNDDPIYHNVFSLSKPRRFDLGRYAAGQSKAVRFDQPGIVRVFCEIHSNMNAFILVFDHRFFALTDDSGRFRIDRVPPGTYRLTAWYEGVAQQTQSVTVAPATGGEANFVLR